MAKKLTLEREIEKEINIGLPELARLVAEDETGALSKGKADKIKHELEHDFNLYKNRCKEGLLLCIKAVEELAVNNRDINKKELKKDLLRAFSLFDSVEHVKKFGEQVLLEGKTWKELLRFKEATFEMLYKGARSIFDAGKYEEAEKAFFVLSLLDSTQFLFWIGFGHSAFQLENYDEALKAYMAACMAAPGVMWPHIYAANCFEAKKDFEGALLALQEAQEINNQSEQKNVEVGKELSDRINLLKHKV